MTRHTIITVALLLASCALELPSITEPAARYLIELDRPVPLDRRQRIEIERRVSTSKSFTVAGRTTGPRDDFESYELVGHRFLRGVDGKGHAANEEYEIDELSAATPKGRRLLASGSTRIAVHRAREKADASILGIAGLLDEDVSHALRELLPLKKRDYDGHLEGLVSISGPQPIGASWPVPAEAFERELERRLVRAASGTIEFVGLSDVNGVPCMEILIEIQMTIANAGRDWVEVEDSDLAIRVRSHYPLDVTQPMLESTTETRGTTSAAGHRGDASTELALVIERRQFERYE